jgi:hypothetical protein
MYLFFAQLGQLAITFLELNQSDRLVTSTVHQFDFDGENLVAIVGEWLFLSVNCLSPARGAKLHFS